MNNCLDCNEKDECDFYKLMTKIEVNYPEMYTIMWNALIEQFDCEYWEPEIDI